MDVDQFNSDDVDRYDSNDSGWYNDNYTAAAEEESSWYVEQVWYLVPLLLAVAALALHSVAARVLWVVSVRCRFGQPTLPDLHQTLLSVSAACLLRLSVIVLTITENLTTSTFFYDYTLCVMVASLGVSSQILLRLLVAFLILRVCLNRPMPRVHRFFIVGACALTLLLFIVHLTIACGGDGLSRTGHVIYFFFDFFFLRCLSLLLFIAALCVVGMRRRRKMTPRRVLQPARAEAGPAAEGLEGGAGGGTAEESGVKTEVEGVEPATSPVRSLENIGLAMGGAFCISFVLEIVFDVFVVPSAGASLVLDSLCVMLVGVAGALYFCMYPGYLSYVRKSFC